MTQQIVQEQVYQDPVAEKIGKEYRRSKEGWINCGKWLQEQKEKCGHGKWEFWLNQNQVALGFKARTARYLVAWANKPEMDAAEAWDNLNRQSTAVLPQTPPKRDFTQVIASDFKGKVPPLEIGSVPTDSILMNTGHLGIEEFLRGLKYIVEAFKHLPKEEKLLILEQAKTWL
ncbi:MAG TPA: hypothetical protein VH593_00360 [Ktedonobacteraceae bacterium]|jgi:hypothetical protein